MVPANFDRSTVSIISRAVVLPTLPVTATTLPVNWWRCQAANFHKALQAIVNPQRPTARPRFDVTLGHTTPEAPRTSASSAKQEPSNRGPLRAPKYHVGLHAAAIGHDRADVRRLAMPRRHGGQPQLAAGDVAKLCQCE